LYFRYYHSFKETPERTLNYSCGNPSNPGNQLVVDRLEKISTTVANGIASMIMGQKLTTSSDRVNVRKSIHFPVFLFKEIFDVLTVGWDMDTKMKIFLALWKDLRGNGLTSSLSIYSVHPLNVNN
jgi:hypothetical protein